MKQRKMVDSDRGMDFAPYVSGFCHIHGKTPRGILPVNSNFILTYSISLLPYTVLSGFVIRHSAQSAIPSNQSRALIRRIPSYCSSGSSSIVKIIFG